MSEQTVRFPYIVLQKRDILYGQTLTRRTDRSQIERISQYPNGVRISYIAVTSECDSNSFDNPDDAIRSLQRIVAWTLYDADLDSLFTFENILSSYESATFEQIEAEWLVANNGYKITDIRGYAEICL